MPRKKSPEYAVSPAGEIILERPALNGEFEPEDQEAEKELNKESSLSTVSRFFHEKIIPGILEGSHQAVELFNRGVDFTTESFNQVIPAATEMVTGFILPEHAGRVVNKAFEYGTKASTYLGKNVIKAGFNVFTLGAPAWLDAFRQHLAVSEGNEKFEVAESSVDLLAFNYIDHLKDEKVKVALTEYYQLRERLAELRKNPQENQQEIAEIADALAGIEVAYKDCVDYSNLKAILEQGKEFMDNNEALIGQLAAETADQMIVNVENFYQEKFGGLAGKVEGKWLGIITAPEKGREKLVAEITERLKLVMSKELGKEAVQMEMKRITGELFSEFGVYRKYFKAAIYSILRSLPLMKEGLENLGVWPQISEVLHQGYESAAAAAKTVESWTGAGVKHAWSWIWSEISELIPEQAKQLESAASLASEVGQIIAHPVEAAKKTMDDLWSLAVNYYLDLKETVGDVSVIQEVKQAAVSNTLDNYAKAADMYRIITPGAEQMMKESVPDIVIYPSK